MAKKKKKKSSNPKNFFGWIKKLIYLCIFILIFIVLGSFEIKGDTPLEHLDNLLGIDVFQDARNGLVDLVYKSDLDINLEKGVDSLEDTAKELFKDTKDGGKKAFKKIKKGADSTINKPMENLTAEDEDDIQQILKEKGRKNRE